MQLDVIVICSCGRSPSVKFAIAIEFPLGIRTGSLIGTTEINDERKSS